jgi:hypothetical protein
MRCTMDKTKAAIKYDVLNLNYLVNALDSGAMDKPEGVV